MALNISSASPASWRHHLKRVAATFGAALMLAGLTAGCASWDSADSESAQAQTLSAAVDMYPQCRNELRAFVDLAELASTYGHNWTVFQDAMDVMNQQVVDCTGSDPHQVNLHGKAGVRHAF